MFAPTLSESTADSTPAGVSIGPRISGAIGMAPSVEFHSPVMTPLHGPRRVPASADMRPDSWVPPSTSARTTGDAGSTDSTWITPPAASAP